MSEIICLMSSQIVPETNLQKKFCIVKLTESNSAKEQTNEKIKISVA